MEILIVLLIAVVSFAIVHAITKGERNNLFEETIARRQKFLETIGSNARAIINDGQHFFFVDDVRQCFGLDESGIIYSYEGLHHVSTYRDCISFFHKDSISLCVGKDRTSSKPTVPLDTASVQKIANVMLPILHKNLHDELALHGITPTFEYEHEGVFWGCDMNSKIFYSTFGCIQIYNFSDLHRITVEDMTNISLYDGNYIIRLYIDSGCGWDDNECDLTFHSMDTKYYNLLNMFQEIRKRR